MTNPFDRNFFNFLLGFTAILFFSLTVLYFTGVYKSVQDSEKATATPSVVEEK